MGALTVTDLHFERMVGDDEAEQSDRRRADEGLEHERVERVLQQTSPHQRSTIHERGWVERVQRDVCRSF